MGNKLIRTTLYVLAMSVLLMLIQYVLLEVFTIQLYYAVWQIYLFHFLLAWGILCLLVVFADLFNDKLGFVFMGCSLLKMFAAIIFLLPVMLNATVDVFANLMIILVPYLFYLVFETYYVYKLIDK